MATPARGAGALRDRVALQRRSLDANSDPLGPWATVEVRRAEIINLRGGEGVQAQRLQGLQPVVVAVRADTLTRSVDTAWRAVNERTAQVYDITSVTETNDRAWVEILGVAKSGAAAQVDT